MYRNRNRKVYAKRGNRSRFNGRRNVGLSSTQKFQVKQLMDKDTEVKHHDTTITAQSVDYNSPYILLISNIPQATTASTDQHRIGDKVYIKSINLRMRIVNNTAASAPATTTWRVMVLQDKSYDTTGLLNLTEVLVPDESGFPSVNSQRNADHFSTQIVLFDRIFKTNKTTNAEQHVSKWIRIKYLKKTLEFSNGSSIAGSGMVYLVVMNSNATAELGTIFYQTRINFTDK